MNPIQKAYCRIYQAAFHAALPLLPYREPERFDKIDDLEPLFRKLHIRSALLITDEFLHTHGMTEPLEKLLRRAGVKYAVYDRTCANPTVHNVEEARRLYLDAHCSCLIALGGGSSIDCAKGVGARIARPRRQMSQLKGTLRVLHSIPTLIAIPTTAGTGSEATLAAVITDSEQRHKYPMNDFALIPSYAVLDPQMTYTLPPSLTATTGMDALTHAVEAYIGRSTSRQTRSLALQATKLIFENIEIAYADPVNHAARSAMLNASYMAGIAFSQSYVGYVHAVAHSLGGQYNIPHGLANAVLLPRVLQRYGAPAHRKLHDLAIAAGVASPQDAPAQAAQRFIDAVKALNAHMGIPQTLPGIREEDIPRMARHAAREANPLYPVPVLMDAEALTVFYKDVMEKR